MSIAETRQDKQWQVKKSEKETFFSENDAYENETDSPYTNYLDFDALEGFEGSLEGQYTSTPSLLIDPREVASIENERDSEPVVTNQKDMNFEEEILSQKEMEKKLLEEQNRLRNEWKQKKHQKEKREEQKLYVSKIQERRKQESSQKQTRPKETEAISRKKKDTRSNEKRVTYKSKEKNVNESKDLEKEKKLSLMYSLWQSQDPKTRTNGNVGTHKSQTSDRDHRERERERDPRLKAKSPSMNDLSTAVFLPTNTFEVGEVVLVPRTRGGFNYGKVTKQLLKTHCYFDPTVEHKGYSWRVIYTSNGRPLFKDLPASYLGKLKPESKHLIPEIFDPTTDENQTRVIGGKATFKDLQNVVFSHQCHFSIDEFVLVPRSGGGFTYGRIAKEVKTNCKVNPDFIHSLPAWRVIVSEDDPQNIARKDLTIGSIGKINLVKDNIAGYQRGVAFLTTHEPIPNIEMAALKESELEQLKEKSLSLEDEEPEITTSISGSSEHSEQSVKPQDQTSEPNPEVTPMESQIETEPSTTVSFDPTKPISEQQISGLITVDKEKLLKSLMKKKRPTVSLEEKKHLIVIDGPNVAKKHGKETEFSANGIKIALDYWNEQGHDAVAFLPEHFVKRKPGTGQVTLQEFLPKASNIPLLLELINEGKVILTPPQDYDDSYCIDYAMKHDGCIVTNDRYWDHIDKRKEELGEKASRERKKWIRDHSISFTFVRDEFLPVNFS